MDPLLDAQIKSSLWKHEDEKVLKKFKKVSTGKVMATVFWDWQGVLLIKYLPRKAERNPGYIFQHDLMPEKRAGKLGQGIF